MDLGLPFSYVDFITTLIFPVFGYLYWILQRSIDNELHRMNQYVFNMHHEINTRIEHLVERVSALEKELRYTNSHEERFTGYAS